MANGADADVFQVLCRQAQENRFVNFVFAKCRSIPLEAEALQPLCGIHDVARVCLLSASMILYLGRLVPTSDQVWDRLFRIML